MPTKKASELYKEGRFNGCNVTHFWDDNLIYSWESRRIPLHGRFAAKHLGMPGEVITWDEDIYLPEGNE